MQAKIAAARRDAEGLKDKIKRKKEELADTSRMLFEALVGLHSFRRFIGTSANADGLAYR